MLCPLGTKTTVPPHHGPRKPEKSMGRPSALPNRTQAFTMVGGRSMDPSRGATGLPALGGRLGAWWTARFQPWLAPNEDRGEEETGAEMQGTCEGPHEAFPSVRCRTAPGGAPSRIAPSQQSTEPKPAAWRVHRVRHRGAVQGTGSPSVGPARRGGQCSCQRASSPGVGSQGAEPVALGRR